MLLGLATRTAVLALGILAVEHAEEGSLQDIEVPRLDELGVELQEIGE